ncbi:hypothetical protein ACMXYQ_12405 [Neptuniibacter sp. PT34_22]|uniref:hypothetical protein n=1 Tax=Neptuniibacter sp. PT34_22 TaxID=3398205 RepID=UPI0039F484E2
MRSPKKSIGTLLSTVLGVLSVGALAHLWIDESLAVPSHKHGAVMARSVVTDPETNQPILVEYGSNGEELREVPIPQDYKTQINQLKIISAATYRQEKKRLDDYKLHYQDTLAKGAELLSKAQYLQRDFLPAVASAETANDLANGFIKKPTLSDNVKSVLVRAEHNRLGQQRDKELVLLTFSVNLAENYDLPTSATSVVLSPEGNVITTAPNNIAYRVGFYGNATDPQAARKSSSRTQDDTIFGPVGGIRVSVSEFAYPGGIAATDSEGKYRLNYFLPPCPVGGFEFTTDVYAELRYQNFRPTGSPTIPYFLRRQDWDFCYPNMVQIHPLQPPVYFPATPIVKSQSIDLWVDVMFLTGLVNLKNPDGSPVAIGDKTEYHSFAEQEKNVVQKNYDFNGDGSLDFTYAGVMQEIVEPDGVIWEKFVKGGEDTAEVQAVYFEEPDFSADAEYVAPDLVRLIDQEKRLEPAGYLKSISRDDYQNTDILVFRESTGELVVERIGLRDEEIDGRAQAKYYDDAGHFFYSIMLRGPMDFNTNIGGLGRGTDFAEFNTKARLSEPYQQLDADHLKPGETVRIIAINRATGYMGSARVQLGSAGDNPGSLLNTPVDGISMTPPNLKVWAERDYTVEQGLTKDEDRSYVIGAEGASLTSDQKITIYTEWLDQDGTPLPEGLSSDNGEQYGYTGRLAKVVSNNVLEAASDVGQSDLAEFPIAPGKQLQVLTINSNLTVPEHYYIHVNGTAKDEGPDFAAGSSVGALAPYDSRPAKLTPFLSPLFDENSTWQTLNDFKQIVNEVASGAEPTVGAEAPAPTYAWNYRPEYQFSQYELEMQAINRSRLQDDGSTEISDLLPVTNPVISTSDELITAMYSLLSNQFERLVPIDGVQELILALGEEEVKVTIGENQTIEFEDLNHLGALNAEDYLSMRLYTNNDAGNVLWEWAFAAFVVDTTDDDEFNQYGETYFVSADDPNVNLIAELIGYDSFEEQDKGPQIVQWDTIGGSVASITPPVQVNQNSARFYSSVQMPTTAGSKAVVRASLTSMDGVEGLFRQIEVIPGSPSQISIDMPSTLYTQTKEEVEAVITVRDQHGNLVSDGTIVGYEIEGESYFTEKQKFTIDGQATIKLVAGYFPKELNTLSVISGNASAEQNFEVLPIDVEWVTELPTSVDVMTETFLTAKVTSQGAPVEDAFFEAYTSHGIFITEQLKTDSEGQITFKWHSGSVPGEASLRLKIGGKPSEEQLIQVADVLSNATISLNGVLEGQQNSTPVIVNNKTSGVIDYQYTDLEEVVHDLQYESGVVIKAEGQPSSEHLLKLKGLDHPNREPQISLLSTIIPSQKIRYRAKKSNVSLTADGPKEKGRSYQLLDVPQSNTNGIYFSGSSDLKLDNFVVNFALSAFGDSDGEVLNVNDGLVINRKAGMLEIIARQETDTADLFDNEIITVSIPSGWNNLAVSVEGGVLAVKLNETIINRSLNRKLAFSNLGIRLLNSALNTRVTEFGFFNWDSSPLLLFSNNTEQVNITLDGVGEYTQQVKTNSKIAPESSQFIAYVKTELSGGSLPLVILHEDEFKDMAGIFVDAFGIDPTHSQVAALYSDQALYGDPYLSAARLMAKVADESVLYRESSAVITVLALLNRMDGFHYLKPNIRVLQKYFVQNDRPAMVYAAIDHIAQPLQLAMAGDTSELDRIQTPLVVMAEMLQADAQVGQYMADSIVSAQDLAAWFDHFTKPADGWIGPNYLIPKVEATDCGAIEKNVFVDSAIPMSFETCRQTGENVAQWVRQIAFEDTQLYENPKRFVRFIELMNEMMPLADSYFKKYAYKVIKPNLNASVSFFPKAYAHPGIGVFRVVTLFSKLGARGAFRSAKFFAGRANHRVDPLIMLLVMGYLDSRLDDGSCLSDANLSTSSCKKFNTQLSKQIRSKIVQVNTSVAMLGALQDDIAPHDGLLLCNKFASSHGTMFELILIAYYHALHELDPNSFGAIVGIEETNKIYYGKNSEVLRVSGEPRKLNRRSDLVVLKALGDPTNPEDRILIEAKSLQVKPHLNKTKPEENRNWAKYKLYRWKLGDSGKTTYHRQYILDNFATYLRDIIDDDNKPVSQQYGSDYKWFLQSWNDYQKPRKYRVKKKVGYETVEKWPGVPPDAKEIGTKNDRDWNRFATRLSRVYNGKYQIAAMEQSLGIKIPRVKLLDEYNDKSLYFQSKVERHGKVRVFNLLSIIDNEPWLKNQMGIPEDLVSYFKKLKEDYNNKMHHLSDIMEQYENVVPDVEAPILGVEDIFEILEKEYMQNTYWAGDDCDL